MVGNVNGIVESMYAAENARTQQSAASGITVQGFLRRGWAEASAILSI